jgi:ABC-type transport system involved in multi-copper enzyme maturation permease subunit
VPAGEIDRGTIDVMFGLPVSRWRVYIAETIVFLAWSAILILLGLLGFRLGMQAVEAPLRPPLDRLIAIVANLYCLCLAVGGLACLVSSMSDRRGRAIATVFGILIASFLQSFLAQFWAPAAKLSFLSLLSYYQPLSVFRGSGSLIPVGDMLVLVIFGVATWAAGGAWFARRDICTV